MIVAYKKKYNVVSWLAIGHIDMDMSNARVLRTASLTSFPVR
jgi:hypothetical protein